MLIITLHGGPTTVWRVLSCPGPDAGGDEAGTREGEDEDAASISGLFKVIHLWVNAMSGKKVNTKILFTA